MVADRFVPRPKTASPSAGGPSEIAGGTRSATRRETFDVGALAAQNYGNERLGQLVTELLLGVR
jgi:hypothetical protein